jgi:ADP-ribose pyrophosphatase YjhB (NUDIX family)
MARVGGIVLDGEKNLLIVFGKQSQKWGVPKGQLEENEAFITGALREIHEETGLNLQPEISKNLVYWGINRARLYILMVNQIRPKLKPRDSVEIDEAYWLDLHDEELVAEVEANANKMLIAVIKKLKTII